MSPTAGGGDGEVRHGPKGVENRARWSSLEGTMALRREDAAAAAVPSADADTRPRKERRG
jgi:hypothetical protein